MSGGAGTRLWPLSRNSRPKQFLPVTGGESLLALTLKHVRETKLFNRPILICNFDHRFLAAEELRKTGIEDATIVLEPCPRNTAPAIIASALVAAHKNPDDLLLILPSDHLISTQKTFLQTIETAIPAAQSGHFVCFGINPVRAETGFGYIAEGEELPGAAGCHKVSRFTEKPDAKTLKKFIANGDYLWNAGIFLFESSALLTEMKKLEANIVTHCKAAIDKARKDLPFLCLNEDDFAKAKDISIDNALMERTDQAVVVRAKFDWADLGCFQAIWNESDKDNAGNTSVGDIITREARRNFLYTDSQLLAAVGVNDLSIIAMQDVVLVAPKTKSLDLKSLVADLRRDHRKEADTHASVYRPWGKFRTIIKGPDYLVKEIIVSPGKRLSSQYHKHRAEHWVVVEGTATIEYDGATLILEKGQSLYIPLKAVHRLENKKDTTLRLIEVQTGDFLADDDIVRLEDDFQRVTYSRGD